MNEMLGQRPDEGTIFATSRTSNDEPCDGSERFLAGGIPYLQLNLFAVNCDHASAELDTDCQVVDRLKSAVGELEEKA